MRKRELLFIKVSYQNKEEDVDFELFLKVCYIIRFWYHKFLVSTIKERRSFCFSKMLIFTICHLLFFFPLLFPFLFIPVTLVLVFNHQSSIFIEDMLISAQFGKQEKLRKEMRDIYIFLNVF